MTSHASGDSGSRSAYEKRRLDLIAARWDLKAKDWDWNLQDPDCHLNEDQAYDRFLEKLSVLIEARKDFCSRAGIIDAGCATGLVLANTVGHFAWGIGVDISPEMIHVAEAKRILGARFVLGDCFNLSAICPHAGAIVSRGVLLSHYGKQQAEAFLRSLANSLVPGGFLLCDFLSAPARGKFAHNPGNKTYFDDTEVCHIAMKSGFSTARTVQEPGGRVGLLVAEVE